MRKARAMLLAGDPLSPQEAVELGFANELCVDPKEKAQQRAATLAKLAPKAMQNNKAMLMRESRQRLLDIVEYENERLIFMVTQPEAHEALAAMLEKRAPDFSQC